MIYIAPKIEKIVKAEDFIREALYAGGETSGVSS